MPVNTAALKSFAPAMRRQLLEAVGRKLDLLLNSQTPDTLSTYAKQIAELREQEAANRDQLLERVAYTWFNRLCALRYLDAKGWHPFGCKVLMPAAEGETQPELLKLMRAGSLPGELKPHTNEVRLHGLLDGQIPPAMAGSDPQGEVYRELVLASSRSYHQLLPELFEGLDDASELLLPDDLLSKGSIAGGFRIAISDEDCEDVEIIGWLYQFYISEKKDQVIGKVVKSEDIPAATQLFTPNWIVKYMVQNSLGAQWLATYPKSPLRAQMEYYISTGEQTVEVNAQLSLVTPSHLNPEELSLIDPACGSGHILVEAYELFKAIYLERGFQPREIPRLILENNLFGLDIDERATQLTTFALIMKGRGDDKRLFDRSPKVNVVAFVDSAGLDVEGVFNKIEAQEALAEHGLSLRDIKEFQHLFKHAKDLGSLIQVPASLAKKLPAMKRLCEARSKDILLSDALNALRLLLQQAEILAKSYDIAVMNPPYLGFKYIKGTLKSFLGDFYPLANKDLFSAFVYKYSAKTQAARISAMTPFTWMFLVRHGDLRGHLLANCRIDSLIRLHPAGFDGATVPVCAFSAASHVVRGFASKYVHLSNFKGVDNQSIMTREAAANSRANFVFSRTAEDFDIFPNQAMAYWATDKQRQIFLADPPLKELASAKYGMVTSDNARFLRIWHEVGYLKSDYMCDSHKAARQSPKKWFPYNKGGPFRKWYGNNIFLINWENQGREVIDYAAKLYGSPTRKIQSKDCYFLECLTWTALSSKGFSVRHCKPGFIFDAKGSSIFTSDKRLLEPLLGLLCSNSVEKIMEMLSPTVDFTANAIESIPISRELLINSKAGDLARSAILISQADWDEYENSWDFNCHPLLKVSSGPRASLESSYAAWLAKNRMDITEMQRLEEENNRLFIEAYALDDELSPIVPIEQISLTVNPSYRYGGDLTDNELLNRFRQDTVKEFLSYATGCMMGRYSLDQPGLILADSRDSQAAQLTAYGEQVGKPLSEVQFKPDPDGIIPVLDGEWFEDDIVARTREFLAVTFPESSVAENLRFIEESLGKDVRKYFCSDFYKDHLQTYKKRPIYWLVQSPKKGFACLIYLHRYTKDTLNQVLNNYFRPYLQKLEARLAQLGLDQLNDDLPARERTSARKEAEKITKVLKECQAWEQDALLPLAQQRIELDLDDGVKVNYLKLQDVLAPIPGLAAREE